MPKTYFLRGNEIHEEKMTTKKFLRNFFGQPDQTVRTVWYRAVKVF